MARERTPAEWRKDINHAWPRIGKGICQEGYDRLRNIVETRGAHDGAKGAGKPYLQTIKLINRRNGAVEDVDAYVVGDHAGSKMNIPPVHAIKCGEAHLAKTPLLFSYDGRHFFRAGVSFGNARKHID